MDEEQQEIQPPTSVKFYSTSSVARMFEVTVGTVRDWIKEGKLQAVKFESGGHWRVSEDDLRLFAQYLLERK